MKVNSIQLYLLSFRLLIAEIRAGKMTVIMLALILAVSSATIISVFSQRLDSAMLNKSSELLGADLRLLSREKISQDWYQQAQTLGLKTTTTLEFPSVVLLGDEMALAAVKAVDKGYPLKGQLGSKQNSDLQHGPDIGKVWLEPRLLALLNAQLGDVIEVGAITLEITAVVINESDRAGNFYSLSPRLMMNLQDVEAAKLVQPGSRVSWRMLVVGEALSLENLKQSLTPLLASHQSFESLTDNNQALAASLSKARSYLSLAAMLAIILAGIAIAMAAQDYARQHFDSSALLRTLGASRRYVTRLYLYQLMFLALFTSVIGLLLGYVGQEVLTQLLASAFNKGAADASLPSAGYSAWFIASLTAPVTLIGFALPPLLRLGRVSPLRVLRRELEPMAWNSWAIYGLGLAMMALLNYWFSQNLTMTLIIIVGGFVILLALLFMLQLLLFGIDKLIPKAKLPMSLRFAWQQINRDRYRTSIQILAFSLTLMVMLIIAIVRNDLLQDWQKNLPENSANFFAMNIQSYQIDSYQKDLENSGFTTSPAFPMVPGRLTVINDVVVKDDAVYSKDPALQRDLVLSGGSELPIGNVITDGSWFSESSIAKVSIAENLAQRLQLTVGDKLIFDVAGQEITTHISSLRKVDWGSMKPNFYVLFSADLVHQLPLNYLTSFYVPEEKNHQLTQIIRDYPGITLLDMSQVLIQIQSLLGQVTLAVEYLLILVLLAGILVLIAALNSSLDDRLQQGAVLRTLGAKRQQLQLMQWFEFLLLGALAGLIAVAGAEIICWILYQKLFELEYPWHLSYWFWLPLGSALLIGILANRNLIQVIKQPPLVILRKL
ncbi:MAG: FtsX-like permease family protein [Oleispira antarctica]|uniref:ABC transporter, permease protein n=1 Tax=Oleispira antarctica RB-8 TaxID=698738 RepID=R4YQW8_OLEAN|nr:FtsX-like permease family protein [Oleispira antarctica]MBQ0792578.1 FtsX-like permease family protein [Oleispira antarctica]CCK77350.1 ABC transporter, permease protein [Oleispira antarctica RB-8]